VQSGRSRRRELSVPLPARRLGPGGLIARGTALLFSAGALLGGGAPAAGAGELLVASRGEAIAGVVVRPQSGEGERAAAEDLVRYVELMTGARLPLFGPEELRAGAGRSLIVVGQAALDAEPSLAGRLSAVAKKDPLLRADAIALLRKGARIYLAGTNDESHYYAVAELLSRWGCRWYTPTEFGECVPEREKLAVGELDYAYAPPFEIRTYWISWNGDETGRREFLRRNRMTSGVGVPNGHALGQYVRDLNPDVFRVPIAEMSTARHVAAKLERDFAEGRPIMLGIEDGVYEPQSEIDRKLVSLQWDKYYLQPSVTDAFMEFYNNVSRLLLAKFPRSGSRIGFLAYSNMTLPPVREIVAERPLVAYLAPIDIDPIHGMDDPESPPRQELRQMLYKWAKVMQGRLAIYDYDQGMLVWRDVPNPLVPSAFLQDVAHYRRAGILGVDTESRGAIGTTLVNLHLRGQALWNPDLDADALFAEFFEKFYGPAAAPMGEYWRTILRAWEETICTEHEYFVIPAIYTAELVSKMRQKLEAAERLIEPLRAKKEPSRNERLYLARMRLARLSFDITEAYTRMVRAAATDLDYAAAVRWGECGLAARQAMADMGGIFTTTGLEAGDAWWPGEVAQYRDLARLTEGPEGRLLAKLPLEWAFRRDKGNRGLERGFHTSPPDLAYWRSHGARLSPRARKDYPDEWEMVRADLYIQAQGIRDADRQGFTGHAWYRTEIELSEAQTSGEVRLRFPGIFNECWLYVNGREIAHREQHPLWWRNSYRFEWDVDLTSKLRPGKNSVAVRIHNPHHFGGMFRRPFLYRRAAGGT